MDSDESRTEEKYLMYSSKDKETIPIGYLLAEGFCTIWAVADDGVFVADNCGIRMKNGGRIHLHRGKTLNQSLYCGALASCNLFTFLFTHYELLKQALSLKHKNTSSQS